MYCKGMAFRHFGSGQWHLQTELFGQTRQQTISFILSGLLAAGQRAACSNVEMTQLRAIREGLD